MYIEDQYIFEQFHKRFIEKSHDKLVIYGVGVHTQRLLEKLPQGVVLGLMDAQKTGELLWGYKVLSYEEVAALGEVSIVIIARNAVVNVIYRRIESFCKENGIKVYDVNGNYLVDVKTEKIDKKYFAVKEEVLLSEIERHEIITFDIFDTLLARKIWKPRDIFCVMDGLREESGFTFSKERMEAEDSFSLGSNPTIYEIYQKMQEKLNLNEDVRDELMRLEFETEKRFLSRREKMCRIFRKTVLSGKKVYLISDMYFTKTMIKELLDFFGISGYEDVFVSSEERVAKQEGLFERFLACTNIEAGKCLHIGDNFYSDIMASTKAGMDNFQIYSATDMLENSIYKDVLLYGTCVEESIVLGKFALDVFGDPFGGFEEGSKVVADKPAKVAQLFIAPVVAKYILWLADMLKTYGNDLVIFPSRDGFLLKQLYEKLCISDSQLPSSVYLYTSRRASLVAAANTPEDVAYIVGINYSKDQGNILWDRFGVDFGDGDESECAEDALKKYMTELLAVCKKEKESYLSYVRQEGINNYKKAAFVDFVAMGSIQEALQRMLQQEFFGYYFLRRSADKECLAKLNCMSLYPSGGDFQIDANIYRFYYFLENVMTSYEPTFMKIGEGGEKRFYQETRSECVVSAIKEMHDAILNYADDLFVLLKGQKKTEESVGLYDRLLGFFAEDYSVIAMEMYEEFSNVDEFMGKTVKELNR